MEIALAALVAAIVGFVIGRLSGGGSSEEPADAYLRPIEQLSDHLREGRTGKANPTEPQALSSIREAVTTGWLPRTTHFEQALKESFGRMAAFIEESIQKPLVAAKSGEEAILREGVDRALGGIRDLEFFLREPVEPDETHNLAALAQQVTKEFIADWEVSVRFAAPAFPVRAHVHRDTFMDALYLLLHNAGQFGEGKTVEMRVDSEGGVAHVIILDSGPGFSDEALAKARDLFYTTKPAGLGLGIPFARRIIEGFGGNLELSNRDEGGAQVKLTLPGA